MSAISMKSGNSFTHGAHQLAQKLTMVMSSRVNTLSGTGAKPSSVCSGKAGAALPTGAGGDPASSLRGVPNAASTMNPENRARGASISGAILGIILVFDSCKFSPGLAPFVQAEQYQANKKRRRDSVGRNHL